MQCPKCRQEISPETRFCSWCGAPLTETGLYRVPAAFSSPHAYTPPHLAEKILTMRSALEGERKQVTVLFADLSGFTSFSERHDPEDVHRVMTRAFELMLEEVHRYEGTVNQFLGDGIMALFGAPVAHEDHVQRALHAALGIRKALEAYRVELRAGENVDLELRQGLNTGTVVVGGIGSDLRMDYTAVGDTTNVAARLVQTAERGRIVFSESIFQQAQGYFFTRPLGTLTLKGKAGPIQAWELVSARQARTRLEIQAERGLTSYVGRESELGFLVELFEKARDGHGQIAFVSGDPGIGKSRLLLELRSRLGDRATWLEGHSSSVGRATAFHPLIDLLKRNFRFEEGDAEETLKRKIEQSVLLLGEDMRPAIADFRRLLSLDGDDAAQGPTDPKQQRANLFEAIRRLIVRAAEIHPQVFIIEDLHWMDRTTEEFLLALAGTIPANRVFCVLTYRASYAHSFGEHAHHSKVTLGTLSTEHSERMTRAMLGTEHLPEGLTELVVRVAEGNPFFVEEIVKSLRDSGAIQTAGGRYVLAKPLREIVVPATIHDLISARIDRLDDTTKRTLQTAAVIGRKFALVLLEETVDADSRERVATNVAELKRLEFIYQSRPAPDEEYAFKHALTQEVAYDGLLKKGRQRIHGRVASAIERLWDDLPEEQYPLLAYHYGRSVDREKAIDYLLRAGDRAVRLYANAEAGMHYADALARLEALADSKSRSERLVDVTIRVCGVSNSPSAFEHDLVRLNRALDLALGLGDRKRQSRVLYWIGRTYYTIGRTTLGTAPAEQALAIADELGDENLAALPVNLLGRLYFLSDFRKACPILERSLRLIHPDNRVEIALAQGGLGWSLGMIGEFDRAFVAADKGLSIARETGHVPTLAGCHMYRGCAHAPRGKWVEATADMRQALALAEQSGDQFRIYLTTGFLGGYLVMQGQHEQGIEFLRRMISMADRLGTKLGLHNAYVYIAESCLHRMLIDEAKTNARKAIDMALDTQQRWTEGWARRVMGAALARSGVSDDADADRELHEAVQIFEDLGTLPDLARALYACGEFLQSRGRAEGARMIDKAITLFAGMGMTRDQDREQAGVA